MEKCEISYIYGLVDPRNGEIRYIGKTNNPKNRLNAHITESLKSDAQNYRLRWLRKLNKLKLKPLMIFLKVCPSNDFERYESEYIKIYSNDRLTNSDESGQGNKNRKKEVLDRQSESSGRKVFQYDLNGIFLNEYRSVRYAAKILSLSHSNISRCCNGVFKHTGGFIFRYKKKKVEVIKNPNGVKKMVIEIDINGLQVNKWESIMECSRDIGLDSGNLSKVCNGKLNSIKGRFFKFHLY